MTHADEAAVVIRGVTKTFGSHTAVSDLSLRVPRGSVYGFIGPNGSGKTTTLRMIMHILHPDSGEVEVRALQVDDGPQRAAVLRRTEGDAPLAASR